MINFKPRYKSEYNKINNSENNNKKDFFTVKQNISIGFSYHINSERNRNKNDRFTRTDNLNNEM